MNALSRLLLLLLIGFSVEAKTITDAEGRNVVLPENTDRVFGSSPPMNYLIYALNPDKMIGLNFKAKNPNNNADEKYLSKYFLSLPVIGSFHGGGQSINLETLISYKPQLVLVWQDDMMVQTVRREIAKIHVPTVMIPFRKIEEMPDAFRLAGEAIGESKRAETLAKYSENIINDLHKKVSQVKPTRYYYAEGLDGLSTECDTSFHVEALNFAGGENVHKCQQSGLLGLEKISFETLLSYNPDVIVVQNRSVYNDLVTDPMWQNLRAVKTGHIHLVPTTPFNWIDRPPSFMRVIGIQWLGTIFHPKEYKIDLNRQIKEFYDLFLHVKLNDQQTQKLLGVNP